jgi:zinc protease
MTMNSTARLILFAALLLPAGPFLGAQQLDRSKPPELGPPPSMKLPPIQHFTLSNGLPVVLMEKHNVPLVQCELIVRCGTVNDPPAMSGLASMTAAMMREGAGMRGSLQLADAIDFLGASITCFAGAHSSGVILHTPLSKLDSALALFGDVALRPTFPGQELERIRKERLTTLIQWHDEPRAVASVITSRTVFGEKYPYGIPSIGEEKSLRRMKTADCKQYHEQYYRPGNSFLILVGDVTPSVIMPKLEAMFGDWKGGSVEQPALQPAPQVRERNIYLVNKPNAPQSELRVARVGASRSSEDYYPLLVMNTILGGSFTSRLNQNLRERHGYTYGASSMFDFRMAPGPFMVGTAVQTAVTDSSLSEIFKELNAIRQPVSDEELMRSKNYLTLRYPENFQSVSQIANQLTDLVVYHLPDDYFNNYTKNILGVTKEDVQRVATKYVDPDNIAVIIVGDRAQVEKGVSLLKLGPIKELTIDDVLGPAPKLDRGK